MIAAYKKKSGIASIIFVVLYASAWILIKLFDSKDEGAIGGIVAPILVILGSSAFFYAIWCYIKAKGRSGWWSLMLVFSIVGLLVIAFLEDRSAKPLETVGATPAGVDSSLSPTKTMAPAANLIDDRTPMFKSGWSRLWAVFSAVLISVALLCSAYYVWGFDACYQLMSISTAASISESDKAVVDRIDRDEVDKRVFCGKTIYSTPLTLEQLARKKVVTQVSFQWLEPSGWVFKTQETFDLLEGEEIKVQAMVDRVVSNVQKARARVAANWIIAAVSTSVALLLVGLGIAWVRRGFSAQR